MCAQMGALKSSLVNNETLQNLFLWNVDLRDDGAVVLAELLAENRALRRLELRQNSIGMAGLLAIRCEAHTEKGGRRTDTKAHRRTNAQAKEHRCTGTDTKHKDQSAQAMADERHS